MLCGSLTRPLSLSPCSTSFWPWPRARSTAMPSNRTSSSVPMARYASVQAPLRSDPAARRKRPHCRDGTGGPGQRTGGPAALSTVDRTRVDARCERGPATRDAGRSGPCESAASQGTRVTRLYRVLLRLFPSEFRTRYGDELIALFVAERLEPRHAGALGLLRFWRHILYDLVTTARGSARVRSAGCSAPASRVCPLSQRGQKWTRCCRTFATRSASSSAAPVSPRSPCCRWRSAIGGNSLIYGLVDGFVLHPFPYPDPDRSGLDRGEVSEDVIRDDATSKSFLRPSTPTSAARRSLGRTGAFDLGNRNISGGDVPERVFTALVLDDLFPVLGMKPALGRGFTTRGARPEADREWRSSATGSGRPGSAPIRNILNRADPDRRRGRDDCRRHAAGALADRHRSVAAMGRRTSRDAARHDAAVHASSPGWRLASH